MISYMDAVIRYILGISAKIPEWNRPSSSLLCKGRFLSTITSCTISQGE